MNTPAAPLILIVDDNQDLAENLAEILDDRGYRVQVALDGSQALAWLATETFSLVISDLRMPGLDGVQVLERIRVHWPSLPVILMTAYAPDDLLARAADGGSEADAFFAKPLDLDRLLASVATLCPPDLPLLLVEDDDDLRETLCEALEQACSVPVVACASAAAAREACKTSSFSLSIVDLKLPDEDGLSLGSWLNTALPGAEAKPRAAAIIYITGHRGDFETALQEVLEAPTVHILEKPFPPEQLLAVMELLL